MSSTSGLSIHGAPQGEGAARVLARAVRDRLDRGVDPEEILVLFRRWGEPAEVALDVLREWGIPVHAEPTRPLGAEPSVAALLLAIGLPVEDWATDRVIRLLRNGQVRPGWPGSEPLSMAAAASVVKASPVFRGREQLLNWLDRRVAEQQGHTVEAERARLARDLVERIFAILAPLDEPRPFAEQVEQLFRLATELGIGLAAQLRMRIPITEPPGWIDSATRWRTRPACWSAWAAANRGGAGRRSPPRSSPRRWNGRLRPRRRRPARSAWPPSTRPSGRSAAHVILADLAEGSFPARDAVQAFLTIRPGVPPDDATRRTFSREMLRFLRVIGSAESSLVLIYPTTDAKGQDLLRAGFLDELMDCLSPDALAACHRSIRRLDPALVDSPELAGSPCDRRVRAVALARTRGEPSELLGLFAAPGIAGCSTGPPPRSRC